MQGDQTLPEGAGHSLGSAADTQLAEDVSQVHRYQFVIVNDNLEEAYSRLRSIFVAERSRRSRMESTLEPILASFQQ